MTAGANVVHNSSSNQPPQNFHQNARFNQKYGNLESNQKAEEDMLSPSYTVEHLATFGYGPNFGLRCISDGIKKLKHMELSHAIWAQMMVLRLRRDAVLVEDENMEIVEAFPLNLICEVTAHLSTDSSSSRDIYNNLLVFIVKENNAVNNNKAANKTPLNVALSEMHIFQCVRISAEEVSEDIRQYLHGRFGSVPCGKRESNFETGRLPSFPYYDHSPPAPIFPTNGSFAGVQHSHFMSNGHPPQDQQHHRRHTPSLSGERLSQTSPYYCRQQQPLNVSVASGASTVFERDVNTLNANFDDIERFVGRIQQAAVIQREIEANAFVTFTQTARKRKGVKRFDPQHPMPILPRQPPPIFPTELEFVDIFQKFKSSFNLLAKLKSHIHEPNAPELLHFLFTPFALILDACTWGIGRHLVSKIYTPTLSLEAKILLENSLTSREKEVWISLGDAWTSLDCNSPNTILRNCSDFVDGAVEVHRPALLSNSRQLEANVLISDKMRRLAIEEEKIAREKEELARKEVILRQKELVLQNREENLQREMDSSSRTTPESHNASIGHVPLHTMTPPIKSAMADVCNWQAHVNGFSNITKQNPRFDVPTTNGKPNGPVEPALRSEGLSPPITTRQAAFLQHLKSRGSGTKIAIVTYDRTGQNQKELTVTKSEYIEILDDTKKWWECRNILSQTGYVPNTILKILTNPNLASTSDGIKCEVENFTVSTEQNYATANGGNKIGKSNGINAEHSYPECVASKVGARGEFRYF